MENWCNGDGEQGASAHVDLLIDAFENNPLVTPKTIVLRIKEEHGATVARNAVIAWLKHARLCMARANAVDRSTWYQNITPELLEKVRAIVTETTSDEALL